MSGFEGPRQVTVDSIVATRGLAQCREVSTGRTMDVPLLPMRVRIPRVGESWLIDRTMGNWSFAALLKSRDLFLGSQVSPYIGPTPPPGDDTSWPIGLPWVEAEVKYWNGTEWSTTEP